MTRTLEYPYWYLAILLGSFLNVAVFMLLPSLGYNKPTIDVPVVVVDFMEWREPLPKPIVKPKPVKPIEKPKPKPKIKPVIKPKVAKPQMVKNEVKLSDMLVPKQVVSTPVVHEETPEPDPVIESPTVTVQPETQENLPTPVPIFKLTSMPRFVHRAQIYPTTMQAMGKEAVVKLEALIDKHGKVRQVRVIKSAGEVFDQAAIESLKASSFIPGNVEGKPVAVLMRIPVKFQLR